MPQLRPFRNADPPRIVHFWENCANYTWLYRPLTLDLLEQHVLAKIYFDPRGFILAWEDSQLVGFAHAGFGPQDDRSAINREIGIVCIALTALEEQNTGLLEELICYCEQYLRENGAKCVFGGGFSDFEPFWLGLYGGPRLPGILDEHQAVQDAFRELGFQVSHHTQLYRLSLGDFVYPFAQVPLAHQRNFKVMRLDSPPPMSWWQASLISGLELEYYAAVPVAGGAPVAWGSVRSLELSRAAGLGSCVGLMDLVVHPSCRGRNLEIYLLAEIARHLARQGAHWLEVHAHDWLPASHQLCQTLKMNLGPKGTVFLKRL